MTVREASDKVEKGFSRVEKGSSRVGKASGKVGEASGKELYGTLGKHGAGRARWTLPFPGKPALPQGMLDSWATISRRKGKLELLSTPNGSERISLLVYKVCRYPAMNLSNE